jgi:4-diphosphocytidyl-2-C-methyl-D-erythritol kinase
VKIKLLAYAKLNLFLEVLGKRSDGFHEIQSVLQTINLADKLVLKSSRNIRLKCNLSGLSNEDNLAFQAAYLLKEYYSFPGVEIELEKKIPCGAGLGGGSSDAAATLTGLNLLWNLGLTKQELMGMGARLGSDVPFFLEGGTCLVKGRGEVVTKLPALWGRALLFIPSFSVLTRSVYAEFALLNEPRQLDNFIKKLRRGSWPKFLSNQLEKVVFQRYPLVEKVKKAALAAGADGSLMSGSGPVVFALFSRPQQLQAVKKAWKEFSGKVVEVVFVDKPMEVEKKVAS